MKYTATANTVNIAFMAMFFCAPIAVATLKTDLELEVGRFLIMLSFILIALALTDWYHLYISNSISGILYSFITFSAIAVGSVIIVMALSKHSFTDLALFKNHNYWDGYRVLLKTYLVGFGIALITVLSIPRLMLIKLVSRAPLPGTNNGI